MPGTFILMDRKGQHQALIHLEACDGMKSLGVYIAVDGNEREQENYLREKAKEFREQVRSSQCSPDTATYTYNSCFLKSIEYSIVVTNFDKKKWNGITASALESSLNKSAMARKFQRDVLYGPALYKGLYINYPY